MNFTSMGAMEFMALFIAVLAAVKITIILIKPETWMRFAKWVWTNPKITHVIMLVLAGITFYYLIQELTIVQILAVVLFMTFLMGGGFKSYVKEFIAIANKKLKKDRIIKDNWLYIIIWIALIIWGFKEIFGL